MKLLVAQIVILFFYVIQVDVSLAQNCAARQQLTSVQESLLTTLSAELKSALAAEDSNAIDSLNTRIKGVYASEAGLPDTYEAYYSLTSSNTWLSKTEAINLSRILIDKDSAVYRNLWKAAKGMAPPNYLPHSLFLRASAEIASGLLVFAENETDLTRKSNYSSWARQALDSLLTMQLPSGAFPFPDLRAYGDPEFSVIIQNFLNACGADSVNVLKDGWIIDDKGTGEFKFDAGVIADAYFKAYKITNDSRYLSAFIRSSDYLKNLTLNTNYNYNTFVSLACAHAWSQTQVVNYLNRALVNVQLGVLPGQTEQGRWVDGHNARCKYHNLIIRNLSPILQAMEASQPGYTELLYAYETAVRNLVNQTINCGSCTGFRWALYANSVTSLSSTLKDSLVNLTGQYLRQAGANGKYLDVITLSEYFTLLLQPSAEWPKKSLIPEVYFSKTDNVIRVVGGKQLKVVVVRTLEGRVVLEEQFPSTEVVTIPLLEIPEGIYLLELKSNSGLSNYYKIVR